MNQPDPIHTQIIKWEDGVNLWSMTIKPNAVKILTTDASIPEPVVNSLADQWAEAYKFIGVTTPRTHA